MATVVPERNHQESTRQGEAVGKLTSLLVRAPTVGLSYALALLAGLVVTNGLGITLPPASGQAHLAQVFLGALAGGTLVGLTLGPIATRLRIAPFEVGGLLCLVFFLVSGLVNRVELFFFSTIPVAQIVTAALVSLCGQVSMAVALAWLFRPVTVDESLRERLGVVLCRRSWGAWARRFGLAAVSYVPIYFLFGMIAGPLVKPYYDNPELGLKLTIPGFGVIVSLEVVRGLIYALALFPLLAVLRGSLRARVLTVGLTIALLNSWVPLLTAVGWPLFLRLVHGVEITGDAFVQAYMLVKVLGTDEPAAEQSGTG